MFMYKTLKEESQELFNRLLLIIILVIVLLTIGTLVYHATEGWDYKNSLYFSTISLTSRGYSEMHPTHWFSIVFSTLYLILGVGVILYTLSSLIAFYTTYYQKRVENRFKSFLESIRNKKDNRKVDPWIMVNAKKKN